MRPFISHPLSGLLLASAFIACGTKSSSSLSGVVFESSRKLDGSDAPNENGTINIWRVNTDGTKLMALTTATAPGAHNLNPQLSPDGSRVVFESFRKLDGSDAVGSASNIWLVNADGTGLTPLTSATAVGAFSFDPQWSPDGSRVVFESTRKLDGSDAPNANGSSNIWLVNADGTGLMPLTTTAAGVDSWWPQWSLDGSVVVFQSTRNLDGSDVQNRFCQRLGFGTFNVWRVNSDGSGLTPLTHGTVDGASSSWPHWSPGSRIVFHSPRKLDGSDGPSDNRSFNIWRVNADGTGLTPLTTNTRGGNDSLYPRWSPDGSKVVFESMRDGTENIWRVNADGTGLTPLTGANTASSFFPQWSPDGSMVVFYSYRKLDGSDAFNDSTRNIWRVNAAGTGLMPLTTATAAGADSQLGSTIRFCAL